MNPRNKAAINAISRIRQTDFTNPQNINQSQGIQSSGVTQIPNVDQTQQMQQIPNQQNQNRFQNIFGLMQPAWAKQY